MNRKNSNLSHFSTKITLSNFRAYHDAELLLKSLKAKGKFTVEAILEAWQHYVKKIDDLTRDNKLLKQCLEQYQSRENAFTDSCVKAETSTDVPYLQKKVRDLLCELLFHRKVEDDRTKLQMQIDKLSNVIKQLAWNRFGSSHGSRERLSAGGTIQMEADRERLKELLNKMLGIEEKIIEFKRQAASAAHLQVQVDKLRRELQDERSKSKRHVRNISAQFRRQMETAESQLKMYRKERDLYERLSKKLELQAKKAINECLSHEKRAEALECKYEKILFELDKAKTKNTQLLFKESGQQSEVVKDLKLSLHECRYQLREAEQLNSKYEKKLETLSKALRYARECKSGSRCEPYYPYRQQQSKAFKLLKNDSLKDTMCDPETKPQDDQSVLLTSAENAVAIKGDEQNGELPVRYWRRVSKHSNMLLKIVTQPSPPYGFKSYYLVLTDEDLLNMRKALVPNDAEINESMNMKHEAESFLRTAKNEAVQLINDLRKESHN